MKKLLENFGLIFLVTVLVVGVGWSLYDSLVKNDPAAELHKAVIARCQVGIARSQLDQRFALKASEARRRSAEKLASDGDKIGAENELATAREYEAIAAGYDRLTVKDCNEAYPGP